MEAGEQHRHGDTGLRSASSAMLALVLLLPLCLTVVVATTALLVPVMPGGESELVGPVPAALLSVGSSLGVWLCWRRLVGADPTLHAQAQPSPHRRRDGRPSVRTRCTWRGPPVVHEDRDDGRGLEPRSSPDVEEPFCREAQRAAS